MIDGGGGRKENEMRVSKAVAGGDRPSAGHSSVDTL